jgi:hypothetical protein
MALPNDWSAFSSGSMVSRTRIGRGRQTGLLNVNVCLGGRCEGRCMRSFFLKVAKAFYGFLPILFRHDDLVGRRTRSAETIQASMRCPFHGFQSVQFFIRGSGC